MDNVIPFPGPSWSAPTEASGDFVTVLSAELRPPGDTDSPDGGSAYREGLALAIDLGSQALQAAGADDVAIEGGPLKPHLTARFLGPTSSLTATRAALALRAQVADVGGPFAPTHPLQVGAGIAGGEVTQRTAPGGVAFEDTGTARVFAAKLRDFAGSGQIFLSASVRHLLGENAQVMELGEVGVDPRGGSEPAYALLSLDLDE